MAWVGAMVAAMAAMACSDEPAAARCAPVGSWELITTTTAGDCGPAGEVNRDALVVADVGGALIAQLVAPGGPVECEGTISSSCSGRLSCSAGEGVTLSLELELEGDEGTGTAEVVVPGDCTGSGTVRASR